MKGVFNFLVEPRGERYSNKKDNNGKELILNTELQNHSYTNRYAVVRAIPLAYETDIKEGDEVIVHHNVFRRFHDIRGIEKNSKSYYNENLYFVNTDQVFMYRGDDKKWIAAEGYCFVKPLKETKAFADNYEKPLVGIIKYKDSKESEFEVGDLVGFLPSSEYEFVIDGQRLYRIPNKFITIKYEYKGDEVEYNPSWTQSGSRVD